jgi:membrane-bound lytic murein transglycosylase B
MLFRIITIILSCVIFCTNANANSTFTDRPDVQKFIKQMVKKHHFKKEKLVKLFNAVKVTPIVVRKVKQPFEKNPWRTYQLLFVTEWRIREGVEFWQKYREALERAEKTYGVPASIIVATIGVETKYGQNTGNHRVIDALTNIAFSDSPRAPFFLKELEQFLLLTREQHMDPLKVTGSYAGAIGQPQFMPSSYRKYAVDFSGNKKVDLMNNTVDVIGSVANYYKQNGWDNAKVVAIPASLSGNQFHLNFLKPKTISKEDLAEYGLIPDNRSLKNEKYTILELDGYYGKEYWFSFHNFNVIKSYNPSDLYAMAVYQLSYYITSLKEKLNDA